MGPKPTVLPLDDPGSVSALRVRNRLGNGETSVPGSQARPIEASATTRMIPSRSTERSPAAAPKAQISRARFLIERCYHHGLQMVQADGGNGVPFSQLTYQTAALGKALLLQYTC